MRSLARLLIATSLAAGCGSSTSPTDFCSAFAAYASRCMLLSACDLAQEQAMCAQQEAHYRASYVSAATSCFSSGSCAAADAAVIAPAVGTCLDQAVDDAVASSAWQALASATCNACPNMYAPSTPSTPAACVQNLTGPVTTYESTNFSVVSMFELYAVNDDTTLGAATMCMQAISASDPNACTEVGTCITNLNAVDQVDASVDAAACIQDGSAE